jgi:capsular exopolysaccharide synthesis family protein
MEIARYLGLVRRWWWLLVIGTVIGGGASYAISKTLTPTYSATATLLVNQTQVPGTIAYNDILTSERMTRTYKELVETRPVLEEVAQRLDIPYSEQELAGMVGVSVVPDTQLLRLSAESSDPALASSIANTTASVFIDQNTENDLGRPGDVSIVEAATTPSSPIRPNVKLNTVIAAVVGLLLGAAVALLLDFLDDTVKSAEDLEENGLAPLGGVARFQRAKELQAALVTGSRSYHQIAEGYRVLRTNVQFSTIDSPGQALLVTSANPGEGKSTTAANLALVMAQAGKKVILVDSDLRRPSLHRIFGLSNGQGLTNLLITAHMGTNGYAQQTRFDNLAVITSGPLPPNPSELLSSRRLDSLLDSLRMQADVVIFDSPPTLLVTDACILAAKVDGTLLVVDSGKTRSQSLRRAKESLTMSKTHLLGAVLNKLKHRGGVHYYHQYYPLDGEEKKKRRRRNKEEAGTKAA